jgi:hypothetical protein
MCPQEQGCQIFLGPNIPKREKYTKWLQNIPSGHYLYQMAVTISILRPSKFYPNREFWFENKPSGNPAQDSCVTLPRVITMVRHFASLRKPKKEFKFWLFW